MAYVGSKGACPTTHPVSVPRLHLKSVYDTYGGPGITLSSGAPGTMHADFWNTWDQTQLAFMIRSCINLSGTEAVCASDSNRRLEVMQVPVADVDRAKALYVEQLGFHADHDVRINEERRVVQCS